MGEWVPVSALTWHVHVRVCVCVKALLPHRMQGHFPGQLSLGAHLRGLCIFVFCFLEMYIIH